MNPDPEAKASVRMTVTTTGIILNMLVVLVLEEVYGAIAVWLTELGTVLNAMDPQYYKCSIGDCGAAGPVIDSGSTLLVESHEQVCFT